MDHNPVKFHLEYSLAYWLFKRNITWTNDIFWLSEAQKISAKKLLFETKEDDVFVDIIGLNNKDNKRYPPMMKDYHRLNRAYSKWMKLSVIVAMASCFEIYCKFLFSTLIKFNPGVLIGASEVIDGFQLIKKPSKEFQLNVEHSCNRMIIGSWNSRKSNIVKIFPNLSTVFSDDTVISNLEEIRKIRNSASHMLGLNVRAHDYADLFERPEVEGISLERFKKLMKVVLDFGLAIDRAVFTDKFQLFEFMIFLKSAFTEKELELEHLYPHISRDIRTRIGNTLGRSILSGKDLRYVISIYRELCS